MWHGESIGRLLDRGVYYAPFTMSGKPVLIAVDRRGELVAQHVVSADTFPGEDEALVAACLGGLLERADPEILGRLRVVRGGAA
jgi:hypothetical protein